MVRSVVLCAVAASACGHDDEARDGRRPDARSPDAPIADAAVDGPPPDGFVPLDAPDDSFRPDLLLVAEAMEAPPILAIVTFSPDDPAVVEGCVGGAGPRRLLRFDTVVGNAGTLDLWLGVPSADNPRFVWSPAHGHYHVPGFADYRLLDEAGQVVGGHKQAYCLMDTLPIGEGAGVGKYYCGNQGITAGWADLYARYLDCQWIDVTGLPSGGYRLEVVVDPEDQFPELDETNNHWSIAVEL
jgi:hypothetical protein